MPDLENLFDYVRGLVADTVRQEMGAGRGSEVDQPYASHSTPRGFPIAREDDPNLGPFAAAMARNPRAGRRAARLPEPPFAGGGEGGPADERSPGYAYRPVLDFLLGLFGGGRQAPMADYPWSETDARMP